MIASQPYLEVTIFGFASGAVFGLLAIGLVLIYRTTGVLNFSQWAIGILGVVIYVLLTTGSIHIPVFLALIVGIAGCVGAGVLCYRLVFSRIPRGNQIILILIAIGLAQLFSSLAQLALGFQQFTRVPAWLPTNQVRFGGASLAANDLITMAIAVGLALGFLAWFRTSQTGRALRAVAQNREAAMLAGIDDAKYSSIAWGIGCALAGLALLLVLPHRAGEQGGQINTFDLFPIGTLLIPAFGAALVGGLVNMPMALLGGFVFGLSRELLVLAPSPLNEYRETIAAVLILVLLLLRTERLFTTAQEREALET